MGQVYEKSFLMKMLENMWTVRKFEQCCADSFLKGEINGNLHVCLGEEGAIVGANMALKLTDYTSASHRGHGHCIMKTGEIDKTMAEIFGRATGLCKGRGGSMHVTSKAHGMLGANGIVGGGIPLATGSAVASVANGDDSVSVAFFGDGATNQGCFHECLNMAAALKLPVVYFIENNRYAVSTVIYDVINTESLVVRADAYGIPGEVVNGQDVLAVYETMLRAIERARRGEGPTLIECNVYRYGAHYIGDPGVYMTKEYNEAALNNDVINNFKAYLEGNGIATLEEMNALEKEVADKIERARQFAVNSPFPDKDSVLDFNYADDNERSVAR